jgi:putative transposase
MHSHLTPVKVVQPSNSLNGFRLAINDEAGDPFIDNLWNGTKALHASVRRALRQAWELDDAAKAEKLLRNLAQRLERDAPLTVSRLGLPAELRRSLACTNLIEDMMGTVRRVTRNVKRWSSSSMALRWTAAAMNEAKKGFRRLKAYKQLPALRLALAAHYEKETNNRALVQTAKAA